MIESKVIQQQRQAWRDLFELAQQCQSESQAIGQQYQLDSKSHDQKFQQAEKTSDHEYLELKQEIELEHQTRIERIGRVFEKDGRELKQRYEESLEQIDEEADAAERKTQESHQQALWLADSILEETKAKLGDSLQTSRSKLEQLQEYKEQVVALAAEFGLTAAEGFRDTSIPRATEDEGIDPAMEAVGDLWKKLQAMRLLPIFYGWAPLSIAVGAGIIVAIGILALTRWQLSYWPAVAGGITFGLCLFLLFQRRVKFKQRVNLAYQPLRTAIDDIQGDLEVIYKLAGKAEHDESPQLGDRRLRDIAKANKKFETLASTVVQRKQERLDALEKWRLELTQIVKKRHEDDSAAENKDFESKATKLKIKHDPKEHQTRHERQSQELRDQCELKQQEIVAKWKDGLESAHHQLDPLAAEAAETYRPWSDPYWEKWSPAGHSGPLIRLGDLSTTPSGLFDPANTSAQDNGQDVITTPVLLDLPAQSPLVLQTGRTGREQGVEVLQAAMARLFTTLPPGRVRFNIIDPVGRGQSFAGFMHLVDYEEDLVGRRIWTESEHIEKQLRDLTEHMENVIQKYLRNEFETIEQYNQEAGELAEPYRCLVIADFPVNFNEDAARRLVSIAKSGPRCGVYLLMTLDARESLPGGIEANDLAGAGINVVHDGERFVYQDEMFQQLELTLDPLPDGQLLVKLLQTVGQSAKDWDRVEVPFASISPAEDQIWTGDCAKELTVPIGRTGATRQQQLALGKGVAQHVLMAGKTGSGKSTLLHVIITNMAQWYSPEGVEFYLIDFKKGVEFKTYATFELPHVQAVAIESDREFGVSVLQRLYERMQARGDLYRQLGVQDLEACRRVCKEQGRAEKLPRILLIIDEFHEFFSEDDKMAQDAGLMLDRLVRQGRAFGVHVLLGSQTLAGAYGLARSTMGQMAVRVALQCSEADGQVILGDNNTSTRLLSRPGEAIYNDSGGQMESNSLFQISWLDDAQRENSLKAAVKRAEETGYKREQPLIVFEGNASAELGRNAPLHQLLDASDWPDTLPASPHAWFGEPITIKSPTAAKFGRYNGSNVLIIGQRDESAMAMFGSSMISLAAQHKPETASFYVLDSGAADFPGADLLNNLADLLPHEVNIVERLGVDQALTQLSDIMQQRLDADQADAPAVYIFLFGLQRFRSLARREDDFSFGGSDEETSSPDKQFKELLRQGPLVGMHIITWCDTPNALDRMVDRQTMREFDTRVLFQMSATDSSNLVDSPMASKLGFYRVLFSSEEQGLLEKFRPYSMPDKAWLEWAAKQLGDRAAE
jgi:S-DNA-T family DNA segregation ATPase FtsK/SpoIIIE